MKQGMRVLAGAARTATSGARSIATSTARVAAKKPLVSASMAGLTLAGGHKVYTRSLDEKAPEPLPYPELDLGEINKDGHPDVLFVPGSISNANAVGANFAEMFEKETGIKPRYINSQMDISDYPGQFWGSQSAKERNAVVEAGIREMIESSPGKEITIIAHSAGTKSALNSIQNYYRDHPGSTKKVNILLAGAGSPEVGLEESRAELAKNPRISIEEVRNALDIVPSLGGTKEREDVKLFTSPKSQEIIDAVERSSTADIDHASDLPSPETIKAISKLSELFQAHWYTEYVAPLAEHFKKNSKVGKAATKTAPSQTSPTVYTVSSARTLRPDSTPLTHGRVTEIGDAR